MGCDIHFYVEQRQKDGSWEVIGSRDSFYGDRNYLLFSILADVRNHREYPVIPISEPKGFPDDVSSEIEEEDRGADWHSRTWLSLSEILTYDWTQVREYTTRTNLKEYFYYLQKLTWDEYATPTKIYGGDMLRLEDIKDKKLTDYSQEDLLKYHVDVECKHMYSDVCGYFWSKTIPNLLTLVKNKDFGSVRCVFAFDN